MTTTIAPLEFPRLDELENVSPVQGQRSTSEVTGFADILDNMVQEANEAVISTEETTTAFARGEHHDIHGTMLALEQADLKVRLMVEMRNHLLEAYREVMRTTV